MAFFFEVNRLVMLTEPISEITERIEKTGIGIKDALSVIDLTRVDSIKPFGSRSPYEAFHGLNGLINRTVHGTTIERFRPGNHDQPFHTFEIHTEDGEALAYLNMVYSKRLIPCYYLVYVEVMPSFRGLGLGHKIIQAFMGFLESKKAMGLLDNIIPPEEPTFEIYHRNGWKNVRDLIGNRTQGGWGNYMVFIPSAIRPEGLNDELIRILFNLRKKRPVIDMRDNEDMVKRTIEEFRSVYRALVKIFDAELSSGTSTPLMRFMFTRLTTKLIGFRRRISSLIGYTGGESLEQLSFREAVMELPIQPYSLWTTKQGDHGIWGDHEPLQHLPETLKQEPTLYIEGLSFYRRPYLRRCLDGMGSPRSLTISNLLHLGFDPTRLREFSSQGVDYIFERISPHFFQSLLKKRRFLKTIEKSLPDRRFCGAALRVSPPLVILRDRGNIYALRRRMNGIHFNEALDQLRTLDGLKEMNRALRIESALIRTMKEVKHWLMAEFNSPWREEIEDLTYFLPWDIEKNWPRLSVDASGISLDTLWLA